MRKVLIVYASLSEHQRVDVEHRAAFGIVVSPGNGLAFEIAVFFKDSYHFCELLSVLEQLAAAKFVKVILPDLCYVFRANFCDYSFCLQSLIVGIPQPVGIYRLQAKVVTDLDIIVLSFDIL